MFYCDIAEDVQPSYDEHAANHLKEKIEVLERDIEVSRTYQNFLFVGWE